MRRTLVRTASRGVTTGLTVVRSAQERRLSFLAASLAYYTLLSLVPLGVLALVVATAVGGPAVAERVVSLLGSGLSPAGADLVRTALLDTTGQGTATVIGLVVALWGGLRIFRAMDVAFDVVYGHGHRSSLLDQVRDGLVALGGLALALGTVGTVTALATISGLATVPTGGLGTLLLIVPFTLVFLPLYVVFPDTDVGVREALPGAIVAAVGWTVLGATFALYAAAVGGQLYGVAGGLLLLVTWLYLASLAILIGAVTNAVLAGRISTDVDVWSSVPWTGPGGDERGSAGAPADARDGPSGAHDAGPATAAEARRERVATWDGREHAPSRRTGSDDDASDPGASRAAEDARDRESTAPGDGPEDGPADEVERLRAEVAELQAAVEDRTVHREAVERDLRGYVRQRLRRGHARGWGPYLVLLYGTAMTIGAFHSLSGGWAILAMIVIWLSTLGLFVLMLIVGAGISLARLPGRLRDRFRG